MKFDHIPVSDRYAIDIRYLRSDTVDNRYRYPISARINNSVISIVGFVDLAISQQPEVGWYCATGTVTRTHTGQHAVRLDYLKDGHLMPIKRPWIDMPPSLVVFNLVTNIVAAALTLMRTSTPVRMGVRAAAASWKPRVINSSVAGRSVSRCHVGWKLAVL